MCTAITLQSLALDHFFGRNMDFSHEIEPTMFLSPRNDVWKNALNQKNMKTAYRFLAIGQQKDDLLGLFDGVNERGFAAAALYFAGYAAYAEGDTSQSGKRSLASLEFLRYLLGNCSSVDDLKKQISQIRVVGLKDPVTHSVAPLHWIAADRGNHCVVLEPVNGELKCYENPLGVLANSPDFTWHMTNLRNYLGVSPRQPQETCWGTVHLSPFGQGAGTTLLPGGYTSPERFVRAAFIKTHIATPLNTAQTVSSCFHIADTVKVLKGLVRTFLNTEDYTKYTAFIDLNKNTYYFNTYDHAQVWTVSLDSRPETSKLLSLGNLADAHAFATAYSA
ncbi:MULTISPECIES: choloylglycine hydrolase family protein [Caproicibacterium]|uniref:Choloylglycine hydrolase family protein n=1 Tax=Caproicibacterium argilliputei TaxID=3030016 RepID=A0AA97H2G3_9FIRM|nr:choloylglycine hydrolase family protein [Caproicibacterium argilliputei]WOC31083.1 choloylglycine hydrolase family protein [Caproicibacterium argilliputei]